MSGGDMEFPEAPLSPSLPTDFLEPQITSSLDSDIDIHTEDGQFREPKPRAALSANSSPTKKATKETSRTASANSASSGNATTGNATTTGISSTGNSSTGSAGRHMSSLRKLGPEEERQCKELTNLMGKWVARARAKKHESDRVSRDRKHRLAAVLALDAVVCFMIGFDYEDRSEAIRFSANTISTSSSSSSSNTSSNTSTSSSSVATSMPGPPRPVHARSWSTLVPYLAKLASAVESVDADLAGVYYQVCAVVRLHVGYLQRRSVAPEETAGGLYSALADFRKGLCLLPLHIIYSRYGLNEQNGWTLTKVNPQWPDPLANTATLPLHVNSSLAEAAAFALNIGRKWAEIEGIEYTWDAAKS